MSVLVPSPSAPATASRLTAAVRERGAAGPLSRRGAGREPFLGAKPPFPPGPPQRSAVRRLLHVPAAAGGEPAPRASLSGHLWDHLKPVSLQQRWSLQRRGGLSPKIQVPAKHISHCGFCVNVLFPGVWLEELSSLLWW